MITRQPQIQLLTNSLKNSFYNYLKESLDQCQSFSFSVAFISDSGLQLIIDELKRLEKKGIKGRLLTTNYEYGTTPKALEMLAELSNVEVKVFDALNSSRKFHTKGYIFEMNDHFEIVVGSSNLTQYALKSNHEWNLKYASKTDSDLNSNLLLEFDNLFNDEKSLPLTKDFILKYKKDYYNRKLTDRGEKTLLKFFAEYLKKYPDNEFINEMIDNNVIDKTTLLDDISTLSKEEIKPNEMQEIALEGLNSIRQSGGDKALVIAATGTGKTYLSAFDALQIMPKRLLFVVHRSKILMDALRTFKTILPDISMGQYTGQTKELNNDFIFASIQTISKKDNLMKFNRDHFDYIIIDEAHRTAADSYQRVINHFKPKFLLGMTATPDRTDSKSIYELYDNQIGVEIRLREALAKELVVPFHYFGIRDATTDLSKININTEIDKLAEKLNIKARVDLVIENIEKYKHSGEKTKALGYCVNVKHAQYMADQFNKRGYPSVALTGESSEQLREMYIQRLEDDYDDLSYIFTVEIFNEGIDIPSVNLVLMLRPTSSAIIFTQQLGRGLRKYKDKEYLTVLDFIGNHNKNFLLPIALAGDKAYDKDDLIVSTANDFFDIPGDTFIRIDPISKEEILEQLESVNFNEMRYLKESYIDKKKDVGRIPRLTDFGFDEFDPVRFIKKKQSYVHFVADLEKEHDTLNHLIGNDHFSKAIKYLNKMLPIKRVYEFAIIIELIKHHSINLKTLYDGMKKYIDNPNIESFNHAIDNLNFKFSDKRDIKQYIKLIELSKNEIKLSKKFGELLKDTYATDIIKDTLSYGLARYHHEFDRTVAPYPYVKLYHEYSKTDMYTLGLFDKNVQGLLMQGVVRIGMDYFLTVNLIKENVHESIDFDDYFIDQNRFHWQSQNNTTPRNETGKNLINHQELGFNLHLFVRKTATDAKGGKGYSNDFIYLGKVFVEKYEGEAPISFELRFEHTVPADVYEKLTYNYSKGKAE